MAKYRIIFFMILFIASCMGVYAIVEPKDFDLIGKTIYIDPGHGGRDNGTSYQDILEKDVNLSISLKLRNALLEKGAIVLMTRSDDSDLSKEYDSSKKKGDLNRRIKLIEDSHVNMYISIHTNWYEKSQYSGIDILYNEINKNNVILANYLYEGFENDNMQVREIKKAYDYIYKNINNVGLLIECGFLSNDNDRYLLQQEDYQQKLVNSIVKSVINYFNN